MNEYPGQDTLKVKESKDHCLFEKENRLASPFPVAEEEVAVLSDSPLCYFGSCAFQGIIASPSSGAPHLCTFGGFQNGSAVPGSSSWSLVMKVRVIMNEGGKWPSG